MRKNLVIQYVLIAAVLLLVGYQFFGNAKAPFERIRIATGGESGLYYAYGNALADALEKRLNVPVTAIQSGGSIENLHLLRNGRAEIAFLQNDIMTYAYNGAHFFSTEGEFKDFSAVAGLYPEVCQIVARRDIDGILGLKDRRVSVGDEGSGTELNAIQILEAYGMSYADIDVDHLSFGASVTAFKEGRIDAFFCTAGVPTPAVFELAVEEEARLLSVGDAHARFLISRYPFYSRHFIPKGTYPGFESGEDDNEEDNKGKNETTTVAVKAVLAVNNSFNRQAVAETLKILFDRDGRAETFKSEIFKSLNRESALEGIPIPMHPEAERYFFGQGNAAP
jgi:TRAP transporter TAXI family solute receptor